MELSKLWRTFFANWPKGLEQRGVAVTTYGEQVSFVAFLIGEQAVLLERLAPDSVGGRKLILPYEKLETIKITDPVGNEIFIPCGFVPAGDKASAAKQPAVKTPTAKQPAAKQPAAKRPAAKQPAAKQPAARTVTKPASKPVPRPVPNASAG